MQCTVNAYFIIFVLTIAARFCRKDCVSKLYSNYSWFGSFEPPGGQNKITFKGRYVMSFVFSIDLYHAMTDEAFVFSIIYDMFVIEMQKQCDHTPRVYTKLGIYKKNITLHYSYLFYRYICLQLHPYKL